MWLLFVFFVCRYRLPIGKYFLSLFCYISSYVHKMMKTLTQTIYTVRFFISSLLLFTFFCASNLSANDKFPDGTPIPEWFRQTERTDINKLGKQYVITDHGVAIDSTVIQTANIQAVIDKAYENGGGVIVIPEGVFQTGSLFFKQGTHLHLQKEGTLKGSDDISDFKLLQTRLEGQTLNYFAALINADGLDGFTISGEGTVNGNGARYWRSFWLRRQYNPKCTNLEEMRPRLVYISNSKNIQVSGVRLINSPFWTSHYYKCENLKILGVYFYAPTSGLKAPSSDGIDLDVCQNVLIKDCYISVNDDAVCLKGGKGPTADKDPNNGENRNILIEDMTFEKCPALTLGSESVHTYNVIMRRCKVTDSHNVLLLKMRPDTPQKHEYVLVEDITGTARSFFIINPWTQFFDLKGHPEPKSWARNITMRNCDVKCDRFLNIRQSSQYTISDLTFENINITSGREQNLKLDFINNLQLRNITINGKKVAN